MKRWPALDNPGARDLALAAVVTAGVMVLSGQIDPTGDDRPLDGVARAVILVCGGSLALRRQHPLAMVILNAGALAVWVARDYAGGPVFATSWMALFFLGAAVPRRTALVTALSTSTVLTAVGLGAGSGRGFVHGVYIGWSVAAVLVGDMVRGRRERMAALEERARQLEQAREEETRRRLAEDRLNIARDLHDTVAHAMATINVQAAAAARVIDRHPDRARDSLAAIQKASGEVLDELGSLVQLLRVDPGEAGKAPAPGVGDIERLVASVRRSGLDVTLTAEGDLADVPRPIGLAAYRIVQESLTNVVRHAGSAHATVTLRSSPHGELSVEITDDGDGGGGDGDGDGAGAGAGVGIRGMHERAATTGGRLQAGPRPQGGFRVVAWWPPPPSNA